MTTTEAKEIITGHTPDCSKNEIRKAWQHLIDQGAIWSMGKYWSDLAAALIEAGVVERRGAP